MDLILYHRLLKIPAYDLQITAIKIRPIPMRMHIYNQELPITLPLLLNIRYRNISLYSIHIRNFETLLVI